MASKGFTHITMWPNATEMSYNNEVVDKMDGPMRPVDNPRSP